MQSFRARSWLLVPLFAAALPVLFAQASESAGAISHRSAVSNDNLQAAKAAFRAGAAAYARNDLETAHAEFAKLVSLAPDVAAGHAAFGAVLLAENDPGAAMTELELAHKLDPQDAGAILNLALVYAQMRNYARSLAMFQLLDSPAAGATPALSPEAAIAYATALTATAQPAAAQRQLERAVLVSPDNASLHDALGAVLAQQGQYDPAKSEFQQAIALDPRLPAAHYHLGSLFLNRNDAADAVLELTQASTLSAGNVLYMIQLGRALRAAGQDERAVQILQHAVELDPASIDPASIDARYELALALQSSGNVQQALPLFRQVVAARPQDPSALTNLGLALVQTGNANSAIPFYLRALALNPANPTLREDLGVAYLQQSDLDHAVEQFRAGLDSDPSDAYLHYDLGLALKLKDNPAAAIAELASAETMAPQLPDPPYTLGVLYMQLGRFAEAQAELEKAIALRPGNGDAWSLLGTMYKQTDQPQKAIDALHNAIQLMPNQPSPHITLASILSEQGDRTAAAAERKAAADLTRVAVSRQRANFALQSGRALLSHGKTADAILQLQAAVDADPTYADAHLALANALAQEGRSADAAIERQKAQHAAVSPSASTSPSSRQ
jgi:protein O-GlcNAc transferase